jgi:tetrahydromethanopterin S-methyltransferase subunit G
MEAMRESWTDKRLDDFSAHVDHRFDAVDQRFDAIEKQTDHRFDAVEKRFESLERRTEDGFARIDSRFDSLQHTLMGLGGAMIVALLGIIATQL